MKSEIKEERFIFWKENFWNLGIYSAPIIASVSLPDIKIYAQTPTVGCGPDISGAPIFREKNNIEEENNNNRKKIETIKKVGLQRKIENSNQTREKISAIKNGAS